MSFEEYLAEVMDQKELHREWRYGQTYFNVLAEHRPDLSEHWIRGSVVDPFYNDALIPAFLDEIKRQWG